jgi:hypothetical protein
MRPLTPTTACLLRACVRAEGRTCSILPSREVAGDGRYLWVQLSHAFRSYRPNLHTQHPSAVLSRLLDAFARGDQGHSP